MLGKEMLIVSDTQEKVNISNGTDYTAQVDLAGKFLSTIPAGKKGEVSVPIGVVVSLSFPDWDGSLPEPVIMSTSKNILLIGSTGFQVKHPMADSYVDISSIWG